MTARLSFCNSCDDDKPRIAWDGMPDEYWICGGCGRELVDVWDGTATFECPDKDGRYMQDGKPPRVEVPR